jgi:catechol 2,3-dioxygenase-like lactoylglutathione lyase family enzyme
LISHVKFVTIPTRDQEKALAFYTEKLGFKVVTNQPFDDKQRWIEMRIGRSNTRFVLFTADESKIGGFFGGALACDSVDKTYQELKGRGVEFLGAPKKEHWGTFATFKDVDGNRFVLSSK